MFRILIRKCLSFLLVVLFSQKVQSGSQTNQIVQSSHPNIIFILADDLGYGELGCYGQTKIETPNIDKLASAGMRFINHYSGAPVCAPARCILLTGKNSGHSYIRGNDEWAARGKVWDYKAMIADSSLEGQIPLPDNEVTIAQLLKSKGYSTGMVGKWGLGAPHTTSIPTKKGFDFFFGYNCQRQAHTHYPVHLWKNEKRIYLNNDTVVPGTKLDKNAGSLNPDSYKKFTLNEYAPDLMFSEINQFISRNKTNPFFLYWATPIPHAAIQAPQRWVDYYVKKLGDEKPYLGEKGYFPHRYLHAGYAAMISYLDEQVGLLIKQLTDLGIYDNTLIIFTSDNGPTFNGGTDSPWFDSARPFRCESGRGKGYVYEGGIRVPMIATWPDKIKQGTVSLHISSFADVLPTFCNLAGLKIPSYANGISFLPELTGKKQIKHEYLYWEFPESGGQMAVRMGDFKAVRKEMHKGNLKWELYNLDKDPTETNNIASNHPEVIAKIEKIVQKEHTMSFNPKWRYKIIDNPE